MYMSIIIALQHDIIACFPDTPDVYYFVKVIITFFMVFLGHQAYTNGHFIVTAGSKLITYDDCVYCDVH